MTRIGKLNCNFVLNKKQFIRKARRSIGKMALTIYQLSKYFEKKLLD
jgi:hypothetical protein